MIINLLSLEKPLAILLFTAIHHIPEMYISFLITSDIKYLCSNHKVTIPLFVYLKISQSKCQVCARQSSVLLKSSTEMCETADITSVNMKSYASLLLYVFLNGGFSLGL